MADKALSILIVDENGDELFLIRHALEQQNIPCDVLAATSEPEAEQLVRSLARQGAPLDIAIVDLSPPRDDPGRLLDILEAAGFGDIPVVFISSTDSSVPVSSADGQGARIVLERPTRLSEYLEIGARIKTMLIGKAKASDA